ncbi:MAG: hypothetical protein F6K55_03820 [Moorea sp. SIO4A3]|nr:hypothetical protein [Moorena sp. SIO4A3]
MPQKSFLDHLRELRQSSQPETSSLPPLPVPGPRSSNLSSSTASLIQVSLLRVDSKSPCLGFVMAWTVKQPSGS